MPSLPQVVRYTAAQQHSIEQSHDTNHTPAQSSPVIDNSPPTKSGSSCSWNPLSSIVDNLDFNTQPDESYQLSNPRQLQTLSLGYVLEDGQDITSNMSGNTESLKFVCQICRKAFADRRNFRRHEMIHTQEKPFSCSFCDYRSNRRDSVKRHMFFKHNEKYCDDTSQSDVHSIDKDCR